MTKRNEKIIIACILCIAVTICVFLFIYYDNKNKKFQYNEHLDEQALTISHKTEDMGEVSVNLQEMAYYIINVEGDINQMAYQYSSEHPEKYWLLRVEATYDMKDYAKDLAFDTCVRNNIYYMEAVNAGLELTEEELSLASDDAKMIMKNITGKQMEMSDFSQDVLYNIEKKLYLASKYVNTLTEEGYKVADLELGGEYYNELLADYNIEENESVWGEVELGELSIEY